VRVVPQAGTEKEGQVQQEADAGVRRGGGARADASLAASAHKRLPRRVDPAV
jgi:hypothetical protein